MTSKNAKILASVVGGPKKRSARPQPRARAELHDRKRSHYDLRGED